jgi:hypothetical protein
MYIFIYLLLNIREGEPEGISQSSQRSPLRGSSNPEERLMPLFCLLSVSRLFLACLILQP